MNATLLLLAALAYAQPAPPPMPPVPPVPVAPSVMMPASATANPNRAVFVTIGYAGDNLLYWMDGAGVVVDVFRVYDSRPNVYQLVVSGDPGSYSLHAAAIGVQNGVAVASQVGTTIVTLPQPAPAPPVPVPPTPIPVTTAPPVSMTVPADDAQATLREAMADNARITVNLNRLAVALKRPH